MTTPRRTRLLAPHPSQWPPRARWVGKSFPPTFPAKHLDATRPPRGLLATRWVIWQPNCNISPLYFWFLAGLCFQPHRHGCCCKCQQRALSALLRPEDDHLHACQLHVSHELDCAQLSLSLRVAVTSRPVNVLQPSQPALAADHSSTSLLHSPLHHQVA